MGPAVTLTGCVSVGGQSQHHLITSQSLARERGAQGEGNEVEIEACSLLRKSCDVFVPVRALLACDSREGAARA